MSHDLPVEFDDAVDEPPPPIVAAARGFAVRALCVLWPAFVMAAALEGMVFAVLDPDEMRWWGGDLIGWSHAAVYTVTFLIFWAVLSTASAMTLLLQEAE